MNHGVQVKSDLHQPNEQDLVSQDGSQIKVLPKSRIKETSKVVRNTTHLLTIILYGFI